VPSSILVRQFLTLKIEFCSVVVNVEKIPRHIAEIDQPFINDLSTGFGGDVAAQVDVKLACDLEVIGGPGIAFSRSI
jgi:hypothetical protein